ncbi:MAG: hypothetical protein ACU84Q_01525 [Gammaproteobacteria bacterium]
MNWEAIIGFAEIVGAIAVVVSLWYVAIQIRQNTAATRYQTTQNLIAANSDANYMFANNGELAAIAMKGCYEPESMSDEERFRFSTWFFSYYNQFDFAYHQYLNGQIDEAMWEKMAYEMPLYVSSLPGVNEWWARDKKRLSKEFVAYMEQQMSRLEPSPVTPTISKSSKKHD